MSGLHPQVRAWVPEAALALCVLLAGLVETDRYLPGGRLSLLTAAVLLMRKAPGVSLTLVWLLAGLHVTTGTPVLSVEIAIGLVSFGCARWGHPATVVVSGISIPAVAGAAIALLVSGDVYRYGFGLEQLSTVREAASRFGDSVFIGVGVLGMLVLAVPWFAGLALRAGARAKVSEQGQVEAAADAARAQHEAAQAQEIARLRDDQARLARDVHDVVGHSLAVILAQAESAQYLPDADTERLKQTMATIATSARSSLQDVRQVLNPALPQETGAPMRPLDTLVEGVRASGHEVVSREIGTPQPLPPELEVVAYRVLQEMLTNALKHGSRDEPVFVERHWPDGSWSGELRIEVRNSVVPVPPLSDETQPYSVVTTDVPPPPPGDGGHGLDGMRRRLEACGGRLDVRRRDAGAPGDEAGDGSGGATFTTTAWVPVRTVTP